MTNSFISIVTPTFRRAEEVKGLLENISNQSLLPDELILVDGAPVGENETEELVLKIRSNFSFQINYIRHGGGTAIQRNIGIDNAQGKFVALIDDDVRLERDFLENITDVFKQDSKMKPAELLGIARISTLNRKILKDGVGIKGSNY
ncbi:MAG: glycosyltransferase family 2 protein [Blastocatellia bacterium]|nr:glycosyltransferase family 2 protein [Blastocatellia bacterium]